MQAQATGLTPAQQQILEALDKGAFLSGLDVVTVEKIAGREKWTKIFRPAEATIQSLVRRGLIEYKPYDKRTGEGGFDVISERGRHVLRRT